MAQDQALVGADLLAAYLGRDAGRRVLARQVQRGEVRDLEAAILFTDLRVSAGPVWARSSLS